MRTERIVELTFGQLSAGSGYLITSRHVLTAKHVVEPLEIGSSCEVQAIALPGAAASPLSRDRRPDPWKGSAAWLSETHDLAIIALNKDVLPDREPVTIGLVPRDDLLPYRCVGYGFPEAAGGDSYMIDAKFNWVPGKQRFDLNVESAKPEEWERWKGISGCVIFAGGRLPIGVICTVDGNWNGLLLATPIELLLEDKDFSSFWMQQGFLAPVARHVSRPESSILSKISYELHRIDRKSIVAQVSDLLRGSPPQASAQVIAIPGVDEDEHRLLIQRLAQDPNVQEILVRSAAPEQVIVDLPWPVEEMAINPEHWFRQVVDSLCKSARLAPPRTGQIPNLERLRDRLNQPTVPSTYWMLIRRSAALGGHGELLQKLLEFWRTIPPGRPLWLLLCLALDEPAQNQRGTLPIFGTKARKIDERFMKVLTEASRHVARTEPLSLITSDHIAAWINELRLLYQSLAPEQFDGLYVSLLSRIGEGQTLRRVAIELVEALRQV